ncbi:hypothetical protein ACJZ2D_014358 [Fusarium nematophilum]
MHTSSSPKTAFSTPPLPPQIHAQARPWRLRHDRSAKAPTKTQAALAMSLSFQGVIALAVCLPIVAIALIAIIIRYWLKHRNEGDRSSIDSEARDTGSHSIPLWTHRHTLIYVSNKVAWLKNRGLPLVEHVEIPDHGLTHHLHLGSWVQGVDKQGQLHGIIQPGMEVAAVDNRNNIKAIINGVLVEGELLAFPGTRSLLCKMGLPVRVIPKDPLTYSEENWKACIVRAPWVELYEE